MTTTLRDSVYYFDLVTFKVEDTLFRVPKQMVAIPGTPFEAMFSLPTSPDTRPEGFADSNPIFLPVSKAAFRSFLHVLCPMKSTTLTYEDWIGALDLSTMWEFHDVKLRAVSALTPMIQACPTSQITLGRRYDVQDWVHQGFMHFVRQETQPVLEELLSQGLDPIVIAKIYEQRARPLAENRLVTPTGFKATSASQSLDEGISEVVFWSVVSALFLTLWVLCWPKMSRAFQQCSCK